MPRRSALNQRHVLIVGISSDIGCYMAERYSADGYVVSGTYRSDTLLPRLRQIAACTLFHCDLSKAASIDAFLAAYRADGAEWDHLIFLPNTPLPLAPFFDGDFRDWEASVCLNAIAQLRVLHDLHPKRRPGKDNDVVFFAAGGVNNAVVEFSAYSISKIMLIKMCEFLDAENPDLNVFIVGPGWVKTKTHEIILANTTPDSARHRQTLDFMQNKPGTSLADIYDYVQWLCHAGKDVSGGRNFSVVGDPWKGALGSHLATELASDPEMYKLRRHRNNFSGQE